MKNYLKIIATLFCTVLLFTACGSANTADDKGTEQNPVKVGVVGENNEVWNDVKRRLADKDVYIDIVSFTDYNQPNEALLSGDLDLNSFQHQRFLDNFNKEKGSDLIAIGDTSLAPLGIYSEQITNISEIKEGDRIAIPDDVSNQARSLILLQTAGLIKVNGNPTDDITTRDIVENPLNLEIIPLDASQTARSLDDVVAACINNGMATDAGYIPTQDAIFLEPVDENSKPYINIIVSRQESKDDALLKQIVAEYQTDATIKVIEEVSKGSTIPAWTLED